MLVNEHLFYFITIAINLQIKVVFNGEETKEYRLFFSVKRLVREKHKIKL